MHRRSRQTRRPLAVAASLLAALVLVIGAVSLSPATADTAMSPLELAQVQQANCQVLLAHATTSVARTRARQCIADQQVIIDALSGGPTPSPSATQTPSPSPSPTVQPSPSSSPTTSTAPATTPPASPAPTSSSPGSNLLTGCFDRLAECGYPTTASTGIPAFAPMSAYSGSLSITSDTTITGKTIGCGLTIRGGTTTIRSSKITGPCFYGIDMEGGSLVIEDSEITCVDGHGTGIAWDHFAAKRVYIHDCENALEMGEGSSVEDSYLSAREATSDGHGDDIQSQGGNGVRISHNTFAGVNPITSSIITNPTLNNGWTIENNLLSSGAYTLYCSEEAKNWVVRGNRFYPAKTGNPHSASYGLTDQCLDPNIQWDGNYSDATLAAVGPTA